MFITTSYRPAKGDFCVVTAVLAAEIANMGTIRSFYCLMGALPHRYCIEGALTFGAHD